MASAPLPDAAPCVLVVEDDGAACEIFAQILQENGFSVSVAATAEAALDQLEAGAPATILLDLRLPTLDGVECLRRIRAMPLLARTPVTVMTSDYLLDEQVITDIEAMGARLAFKPLWEKDLLRIVREDTSR